ncbi:MAG: proton-conducting transporter membrane subunit [Armatimonadota bacterium]|nr:proton-conducting transporter membrane subunit [Armatimonadota bacterium]
MPLPGGMSLQLMFAALLGGAVIALILGRRPRICGWAVTAAVAVAGALGLNAGATALGSPGGLVFSLGRVGLIDAALTFRLDTLGVIFLWLALAVGLLCTAYSVAHLDPQSARSSGNEGRDLAGYYAPLMLLLTGMAAVVCISDLLFFFAAWEFMSLPAYILIIYHRRRPQALRAGLKYFVMTHLGNFGIQIGILMLYRHGGSFSFEAARLGLSQLLASRPFTANAIMALVALGFMTKAGIFPMGDWLPDAHPEAPSPISALLSGVMIKLGAYGIIRFFLGLFIPAGPGAGTLVVWGLVLAGWGALSILLGGIAAAVNSDAKRLLAYSSISQAGCVLLSIGVAVALVTSAPAAAALAFVGAVVFVVADGLHKSLLFLSAGSVRHRTGTTDLNELGALAERMPLTAATAAVGVLSVAGIPPMAGFLGKWLILQAALLQAGAQPLLAAYAVAAVVGSVLSLAYGLKYVGATFVGAAPEGRELTEVTEVPRGMRVPQLLLAAGCVLVGVWPALLIEPGLSAWGEVAAVGVGRPFPQLGITGVASQITGPGPSAAFAPLLVLVLIAVACLIAWGLSRAGRARIRQVAGWQAGLDLPAHQLRVPARGYYWPVRRYLQRVYPQIGLPRIPELTLPAILDVDRWAFDRLAGLARWIARQVGRPHTGRSQAYVAWQVLGAAAVMVLLAVLSR